MSDQPPRGITFSYVAASMRSLIFFLVFSIFSVHSFVNNKPLFLTVEDFVCKPCARPAYGLKLYVKASRQPCLHAGQPVFHWPEFAVENEAYCKLPEEFVSDELSLDRDTKLTFARTRVCFYDSEWIARFRIRCGNGTNWEDGMVRIEHEVSEGRNP